MFFSQSSSFLSPEEKKVYLKKEYPPTLWALHMPQIEDENFIAILKVYGVKMAIKLNPTDARGYRCLVVLVDEDMASTFNRPYSDSETMALAVTLTLTASLYENFGMAVNTEIAGNNAQSVEEGVIQMGSESEPSLLHGHVIGRGNPKACYISDVPLRGPVAGKLFNMVGNGPEPGNDKKHPWNPGEIGRIANILAVLLPKKIHSSDLFEKMFSIESLKASSELGGAGVGAP